MKETINDCLPEDLDWVIAYQASMPLAFFRALSESIKADAESARRFGLAAGAFRVSAGDREIVVDETINARGYRSSRSVVFSLRREVIVVTISDQRGNIAKIFSGKPLLTPKGRIHVLVEGSADTIPVWEFRRRALADLFFSS